MKLKIYQVEFIDIDGVHCTDMLLEQNKKDAKEKFLETWKNEIKDKNNIVIKKVCNVNDVIREYKQRCKSTQTPKRLWDKLEIAIDALNHYQQYGEWELPSHRTKSGQVEIISF